jgi:hypothetical protein
MARDKAYYEAEKKIEEARRKKAMALVLSYMKLTELPESLGQLIHLKWLDVIVKTSSDTRGLTLPQRMN